MNTKEIKCTIASIIIGSLTFGMTTVTFAGDFLKDTASETALGSELVKNIIRALIDTSDRHDSNRYQHDEYRKPPEREWRKSKPEKDIRKENRYRKKSGTHNKKDFRPPVPPEPPEKHGKHDKDRP